MRLTVRIAGPQNTEKIIVLNLSAPIARREPGNLIELQKNRRPVPTVKATTNATPKHFGLKMRVEF